MQNEKETTVNHRNYTNQFTVEQSPESVFRAINNPRAWWSEAITGRSEQVGDRFTHTMPNIHRCEMQVRELIPGKKVAWKVIDNYFSFTKDETEWKDTDIIFEIKRNGDKTEMILTHVGLVPEYECYNVCQDGWSTYLKSLRSLIVTGKGMPNVGEAITESEQRLMSVP